MTAQSGDGWAPAGELVRSYRTSFERDEDPIAEGGVWLNGGADGIDWANVITRNGLAYGAMTRQFEHGDPASPALDAYGHRVGAYDDPTAVLAGPWGRNQIVKARVFSRNQTEKHLQEVEIRLRSTIAPHVCTGYEVFWRCLKSDDAYVQVVRWNGVVLDWTTLQKHTGSQFGVQEGDLVEATIVGAQIRGFINGVQVIAVTDDTFQAGSPGIGFNYAVGDTNVDHGFTYFEADTYDD